MSSLELHLPDDYKTPPQYKIKGCFYDATSLNFVKEEISTIIITMHPSILKSKPILVRTNGNGWILYDTVGNNLRILGSSPNFSIRTNLAINMWELKTPSLEVKPILIASFDEHQKMLIRNSIINAIQLPEAGLNVEGSIRAVQIWSIRLAHRDLFS